MYTLVFQPRILLINAISTKHKKVEETAIQGEHYPRCVKGMALVAMIGKAIAGHLMLESGE